MSEQLEPRDDFNFSGLKLEDVKVNGDPLAQPAPTPEPEPAPEPTPPAPAPDPQPEPPAPPAPAPVEPQEPQPPAPKPEPVAPVFKDDFIKGVVEYYEKTGDITPYLQAKLVDFEKMSDEEIMRRELREQHGDISDKAFETLFKMEVIDKFKLDPDNFSEDEVELGKELLRSQASKIRQNKIEWQNSFKAPEPVKDEAAELAQKQAEQQAIEAAEKFVKDIRENPATAALIANKKIAIKHASGELNFEVSQPDALVEMAIDNNKFFQLFVKEGGGIDHERWYKVAAFAANPDQYDSALINHGQTLGREEINSKIKNPSGAEPAGTPTESTGDFYTRLLQAFAERGVSK